MARIVKFSRGTRPAVWLNIEHIVKVYAQQTEGHSIIYLSDGKPGVGVSHTPDVVASMINHS